MTNYLNEITYSKLRELALSCNNKEDFINSLNIPENQDIKNLFDYILFAKLESEYSKIFSS